jgi:hypothetical protein
MNARRSSTRMSRRLPINHDGLHFSSFRRGFVTAPPSSCLLMAAFCFSAPDRPHSPRKASFRPEWPVLSPPKAAPKEEKKPWFGVPVGLSECHRDSGQPLWAKIIAQSVRRPKVSGPIFASPLSNASLVPPAGLSEHGPPKSVRRRRSDSLLFGRSKGAVPSIFRISGRCGRQNARTDRRISLFWVYGSKTLA